MRSMVEGADTSAVLDACPLHRFAVPLPRCAGEDWAAPGRNVVATALRGDASVA